MWQYIWAGLYGLGFSHCAKVHLIDLIKRGSRAGVVTKSSPLLMGIIHPWSALFLDSRLEGEIGIQLDILVKNGTIYQACNFDFLGQTYGAKYMYRLSDGSLKTSRYFDRTSSMKKYAKILGIEWKPEWTRKSGYQIYNLIPQELKDYAKAEMSKCRKVKQAPKGKYVLLLNYGKDKCKKTWEPQPYPKREKGY